jgi:putative endonuclease
MQDKDRLGRWGEELAAAHLEGQGLQVLERNWRCAEGEIDVVATDGGTLVVCEVKTRRSTRYGTPLEAVGPSKVHRLQRLAFAWCQERKVRPRGGIRIDVVEVLAPRDATPLITHHRGVV